MQMVRLTEIKQAYKRREMHGIFVCPVCGKEKEYAVSIGEMTTACSNKCRAALRNSKRPNKRKSEPQVRRVKNKAPEECIGCHYWGTITYHLKGCNYCLETGTPRMCKSEECRTMGFYKPK